MVDFKALADRLGSEVAAVKAMDSVESSGQAWWDVGGERLPAIRHEAHHFSARTDPPHRYDESNPDISSPVWDMSLAAGTEEGAWAQHRKAMALDPVAAIESASWGRFQVMGFNWARLAYASAQDFADSMMTEDGQVEAFVRYIEADPALTRALQRKDWRTVAALYNGSGAVDEYSGKLERAYARFKEAEEGDQSASFFRPVLHRGHRGSDVEAVQRALLAAGHDPQGVDGRFGWKTYQAVKSFQRAAGGLKVDGVVGPLTREVLFKPKEEVS